MREHDDLVTLRSAASLAMRNTTRIKANWLRPSQQSASQNISGCVPVSVRDISAGTGMASLLERFYYLSSAFRTKLRCSTRVYCNYPDTSAFSLVSEYLEEPSPSGIHHLAGHPAVPDHSRNAQAFHSDQTVTVNKLFGDFVLQIEPDVRHLCVSSDDTASLLFVVLPAKSFAGEAAMFHAQFSYLAPQRLNRREAFAVAGGEKRFDADIDTNSFGLLRSGSRLTQFAAQQNEPFIDFAANGDGFDLSFPRPVQINTHGANVLESKLVVGSQLAAVSDSRISKSSESAQRLKARMTRLFSCFHSHEEIAEGSVQSPHGGLCGREVQPRKVGVDLPLLFVPAALIGVFNRALALLPLIASLLKAGVVKAAVCLQRNLKLSRLVDVRLQTVLECAKHTTSVMFLAFLVSTAASGKVPGPNDDLMDTGIMALERVRQGGWLELDSDWSAEPEDAPDLVLSRPQPPRGGWY